MICPDSQTAKRVKDGDKEAFGEIYLKYHAVIFRYVHRFLNNKELTEDITQDIFLRVFTKIHSFDEKRKFSSWLFKIAHNMVMTYLISQGKKSYMDMTFVADPAEITELMCLKNRPDEEINIAEQTQELQEALNQLSPRYKNVLTLFYFEKKTYLEIAQKTGYPVSTIGTFMSRGRKKLETILKNHYAKRMDKIAQKNIK